ncbi:hypothetical protein AB0D67_04770 [Streptosporangium sp. NPDC048047]|uniref:hypothetical protein n=1 Tax=Streptosporangium sp. NPDC048047 TaxID=3155748 RepID=UPI003422F720
MRKAREALPVAVLAVSLAGCGLVAPSSSRTAGSPAASPSGTGGFVTRNGGSFYLFSLLNHPQGITQVLTVGASVPRGRRTIDEIAGDWYS